MGVLVQIRNMPEEAHRVLKSRAALRGQTLSDYLREELVELASQPSPEDFWRQLRERPTLDHDIDIAGIIREEREARERW
jgi:plasmid stability protein